MSEISDHVTATECQSMDEASVWLLSAKWLPAKMERRGRIAYFIIIVIRCLLRRAEIVLTITKNATESDAGRE